MLNEPESDNWDLPQGELPADSAEQDTRSMIVLDPVQQEDGQSESALAMEGDWHEIPSLKGMLFEDALMVKEKLKAMEQGAYVTIKEALKKSLPHQYKFLKELKDILIDRNSLRDL